jgi:hypothetical protein
MPRVEVLVKLKDGQNILLTEGDLIQKTVIIECNSQRCASRHGQELPQEVSLIDGQPMPAEGRQWLSLILPETSPQYTPMPPNFCSPSCVRDFLSYQYIAPSSAGVNLPPNEYETPVQKTDSEGITAVEQTSQLSDGSFVAAVKWPEVSPPTMGFYATNEQIASLKPDTPEPTVIGQADGAGE